MVFLLFLDCSVRVFEKYEQGLKLQALLHPSHKGEAPCGDVSVSPPAVPGRCGRLQRDRKRETPSDFTTFQENPQSFFLKSAL